LTQANKPPTNPVRFTLNHILVMADRERVGRQASPSAAVIDSLSRLQRKRWRQAFH
jgi:hypothetical protein